MKSALDSYYEYEDGTRVELGCSWLVRPEGGFRVLAEWKEDGELWDMRLDGVDERSLTGWIRPRRPASVGDWKHETPLTMTLVSSGGGSWTWEGTVQGEPEGSNDYFLRLVGEQGWASLKGSPEGVTPSQIQSTHAPGK